MPSAITLKPSEPGQPVARDYRVVAAATSGLGVALLGVSAAWWLLRRWTGHLVGDIRDQRLLDDRKSPRFSTPILSQVRDALREAEERQRLEIDFRENWTPQALQQVVREHSRSPQIIVASNREPYIHERDATEARAVQVLPAAWSPRSSPSCAPARAPGWRTAAAPRIARSSTACDRLRVPPDDPSLCAAARLAHRGGRGRLLLRIRERRPVAAVSSRVRAPGVSRVGLAQYEAVNRKFAAAIVSEESRRERSGGARAGLSLRAVAAG